MADTDFKPLALIVSLVRTSFWILIPLDVRSLSN